MMDQHDLIIVGAGWHGIAMAKTYTEVCPNSKMLLIDCFESVGGVWAKERLYPGLKTNNVIGSYEFSDFPMAPEKYGQKPGQHILGETVHAYMEDAMKHFNLTPCLKLGTNVDSAELLEDGSWLVTTSPSTTDSNSAPNKSVQYATKKLVLATGLTSVPSIPTFVGQDKFGGIILHSKELKAKASALSTVKNVVVVGANKSAWDTCYSAATAGAQVHMVIRPTGGGPSYFWPGFVSKIDLLKTSAAQMASRRYLTWLDPCIWAGHDGCGWINELLHRTWLGRLILQLFWNVLGYLISYATGYDDHHTTKSLKAWTTPYWMGMSLSVHNYDVLWLGLVREGKIKVHVGNIDHLSNHTVHLTDGTVLEAETLVCCTGWKRAPPIKFLPEDLPSKLGLPGPLNEENTDLIADARARVLNRRPDLRSRPRKERPEASKQNVGHKEEKLSSPYQLYHFMVPYRESFFAQRNIAFIGYQLALLAVAVAQAQALWITAYFEDKIENLQIDKLDFQRIKQETILHAEFEKIRHPPDAGGSGARCPDMVFDCIPYIDMLLADLGVQVKRKKGKGAWWREWIERYRMGDWMGLVEEWKNSRNVQAK